MFGFFLLRCLSFFLLIFFFPRKVPLFFFLSVVALVASKGQPEDLIQVHVVPHTHDDVGWLKVKKAFLFSFSPFSFLTQSSSILDRRPILLWCQQQYSTCGSAIYSRFCFPCFESQRRPKVNIFFSSSKQSQKYF